MKIKNIIILIFVCSSLNGCWATRKIENFSISIKEKNAEQTWRQLLEILNSRNADEIKLEQLLELLTDDIMSSELRQRPAIKKAIEFGNSEKIISYLLRLGFFISAIDNFDGYSALHQTVLSDNKEIASFLIESDRKVLNIIDKDGITATELANKMGKSNFISFLKEVESHLAEGSSVCSSVGHKIALTVPEDYAAALDKEDIANLKDVSTPVATPVKEEPKKRIFSPIAAPNFGLETVEEEEEKIMTAYPTTPLKHAEVKPVIVAPIVEVKPVAAAVIAPVEEVKPIAEIKPVAIAPVVSTKAEEIKPVAAAAAAPAVVNEVKPAVVVKPAAPAAAKPVKKDSDGCSIL